MGLAYARAGNVREMPFGGAFVYVCVAVHAVGRACMDVYDLFSAGSLPSAVKPTSQVLVTVYM